MVRDQFQNIYVNIKFKILKTHRLSQSHLESI